MKHLALLILTLASTAALADKKPYVLYDDVSNQYTPRTILPRMTVALRSNDLTLSARAGPWCLRKNRMWPRRLSR